MTWLVTGGAGYIGAHVVPSPGDCATPSAAARPRLSAGSGDHGGPVRERLADIFRG